MSRAEGDIVNGDAVERRASDAPSASRQALVLQRHGGAVGRDHVRRLCPVLLPPRRRLRSRVGTYLDPPLQPIRGLFLLHGAVFTAWFLLQLVQSLLLAGKKLAVHKLLGETAMVLAPLIVIVSVLVVFYTTRHVFHGETRPTVQSAAFPLSLVTGSAVS